MIKDFSNISEIKVVGSLDLEEDEKTGKILYQADVVNKLLSKGWIILHFDKDKIYLGLPKNNE